MSARDSSAVRQGVKRKEIGSCCSQSFCKPTSAVSEYIMHVHFLHRLSFTQARSTILISILLTLVTTVYQIRTDLCRHRQETASMVNQVLRMQEESAALSAWAFDTTSADRVINGLFQYSPILEAKLTSDSGTVLAQKQRAPDERQRFHWLADAIIETTTYTSQLHVAQKKDAVGTLFIRIDNHLIAEAFLDRTANNILSTAVPLVILSFILVLMFYYSLTKPLMHLSARLAAIDTEQPMKSPLEIPQGHRHDELGLVVATTNNLLNQFAQLLEARKAVEKDLQDAETKYRSMFDNAIEGIYQSSLDGRFISANPALAKALGYESPEQLMLEVHDIGQQIYVDQGRRDEILQQLMQNGFIINMETRFYRRDGSILWGSQNARVVRDETGRPLFIEGTVSDISTAKQAMADLARLEAQLMQSQKMEALGNLTGGVAHDFNNLLQIISGYVQLLLVRKEKEDQDYPYLYEVSQAAARASELIRRMLTFSRKVEVQMTPLNLNTVIHEALRLLERTVPKMISLQTFLAEDLAIIPADLTQMEQVIMNLANNAVQAMEDSGVLTIETENFSLREKYVNTYLELDPGEYVLMKVTDTGRGMDEATRQRIFEPFFTTKEPGKGTGLGLSSVYGIVTGHSGKITCYSEPGLGTTFKIFLPAIPSAAGIKSLPEIAPTTLKGGSENILLVDDEETIISIATDILKQYGYTTCSALSGEAAIDSYREHTAEIDLILMDLGMPGMGGRKCLEELLKIDPRVKVIVASGYGSYDIIKNPTDYGAAAFLSKPYRLDILISTVRTVLDR